MLNINFDKFKSYYADGKNQILYLSVKTDGDKEIKNLINNFLVEKNSFIFESVEKGFIKGRYTIFGSNPDKIWQFNKNKCSLYHDKRKINLNGKPKENIEKIIQEFNFEIPKKLPPISSLISGYFSYDIIRYIEKVPNTTQNDLGIPDARIMRPRNLIVHDNIEKKIFFIVNVFKDEKIKNIKEKYISKENEIENMIFLSNYNFQEKSYPKKNIKINVKSNISKNKFINNVIKAKKYIKVGDIFQVVLSQRFEARLTKKPIEIYKTSNNKPISFYVFLILMIFKCWR